MNPPTHDVPAAPEPHNGAEPPVGDGAPNLTSRTLAGFGWALAAAAGHASLALLILMALSRLLTPSDFGLFAVGLIVLRLAESVARQCVGLALVQRFDLTNRHIATGFSLALASGVALAAAMWASAPLLGRWLALPELPAIVRTLSPVCIVTALGIVSEYLLRRRLRFRHLMVAGIVSRAAGTGLASIVLALLGFGVWALVWGTVLRQALFTAVVAAYRLPPRPRLAPREAAELLRTGTGFSAIELFNIAARDGVRIIVAQGLGAAPLGLFTRASALAQITARLSPVLRDVLIPALARRQRQTGRVHAVYLHGIELLALALPCSLMIAVTASEIVAVVLGGQWDAAAPVLRILALAAAFHACNAVNDSAVRAIGAVWRESWRRALYCALLTGGAWWASRWGLAGVAAAVACAWTLTHLLMSQLTLSLLGLPWRRLLRSYVPALWVGLCATAVLWVAAGQVREAGLGAFAALAVELAAWGGAAGAAAYWAPPFARPRFAGWMLAQVPFDRWGCPGRLARAVLKHLARRWRVEPPA